MRFKVFTINVLLSTVFITFLFPIEFSKNPNGIEILRYSAISFYIYLLFAVLGNLVISAMSFIFEDFISKIIFSKSLFAEFIIRLCLYGFAPVVFSYLYIKGAFGLLEASGLIQMVLITIPLFALLETLFSKKL